MKNLLSLLVLVVAVAVLAPPSEASATQTGPLDIATLPAYPNYPVVLDGVEVRTDASGIAHFPNAGNHSSLASRLSVKPRLYTIGGVQQRVEPARIQSNDRGNAVLFNVFYLTRFTFKNSNGGPLDAKQIRTLTVKNSVGAVQKLPAHEATWLQGSRIVPLAGGLEVKKLYWTVQDVRYAGTSVVNASQQRFLPADVQNFEVSLLFYRARLRVHDALFGFRLGGAITLINPDRTRQRFALDRGGAVELPSLPRGNYEVVMSSMGPRMTQQVAISTNQDLDLKYYGWIDIAVISGLGVFFTLGLLWIGLRRRRRIAHRRLQPTEAAEPVEVAA
jgi:hypothetical protein